jgi:hypothetical protein
VLRDSAQAAVGCDAAAEELVSGELRQVATEKGCMRCTAERARPCGSLLVEPTRFPDVLVRGCRRSGDGFPVGGVAAGVVPDHGRDDAELLHQRDGGGLVARAACGPAGELEALHRCFKVRTATYVTHACIIVHKENSHVGKLHIVSCAIRRSMTSPRLFLKIVPALRYGLCRCECVTRHVHYGDVSLHVERCFLTL